MTCARCESSQTRTFPAEINIHFPGYEGLTKPPIWVFPQVLVCLDCGSAQFSIPESELKRLIADGGDNCSFVGGAV